nr:macro domain-containing protein [Aliiroseovarius subalbicans]
MGLAGDFDVIVHGCNCFGTMGAGIAQAIAAQVPEALEADLATPLGNPAKLGTISTATHGALTIVNAYTQFRPAGPAPLVDLDAVSRTFDVIATRFPTARIGYPLIGAGLAGGNWNHIAPRINTALSGLDHCLVTLPGAGWPKQV